MKLALKFGKTDVSAIFSNLGVVTMPLEYSPYINCFGVFTSTPKMELSICSYMDNLVLSFASSFEEQNIERNFFRTLKSFGMEAQMKTDQFPEKQKPKYAGMKFFQWFTFGCVTAAAIAIAVNVIFTPHLYWAAFTTAGALSMWIALAVGFFKRHNLLKNGMWQMILISAGCIIWDVCTGWNAWSVDYVFPGVCLVIELSFCIITWVQKYSVQEYMIYYIMAGVFGLIPALLVAIGLVQVVYLSVVCSCISFLLLIGLFIFKGKDMFAELYKKLHF